MERWTVITLMALFVYSTGVSCAFYTRLWWTRRSQRLGWGADAQTCSMCAHKVPVWFVRTTHADCSCGQGLRVLITCNICRAKDDVYPLWGETKVAFEARKAGLPPRVEP